MVGTVSKLSNLQKFMEPDLPKLYCIICNFSTEPGCKTALHLSFLVDIYLYVPMSFYIGSRFISYPSAVHGSWSMYYINWYCLILSCPVLSVLSHLTLADLLVLLLSRNPSYLALDLSEFVLPSLIAITYLMFSYCTSTAYPTFYYLLSHLSIYLGDPNIKKALN